MVKIVQINKSQNSENLKKMLKNNKNEIRFIFAILWPKWSFFPVFQFLVKNCTEKKYVTSNNFHKSDENQKQILLIQTVNELIHHKNSIENNCTPFGGATRRLNLWGKFTPPHTLCDVRFTH